MTFIKDKFNIPDEEYDELNLLAKNIRFCPDTVTTCIVNGRLNVNSDWWGNLDLTQKMSIMRHELAINRADLIFSKKIECECGRETHNFMFHSDWCPKWEKL